MGDQRPAVTTPAGQELMALHDAGEHEGFYAHLEENWLELWYACDPTQLRQLIEQHEPPACIGAGAALVVALTGAAVSAPVAPRRPLSSDDPRRLVQTAAIEAGDLRMRGRPVAAMERIDDAAPAIRRISGAFLDTSDGIAAIYALQAGSTALLAGDLVAARAHFLRGASPVRPARFPFAARDTAAKMALTHAMAGDMGEAQHWATRAHDLAHTESWVETLIDDTLWLVDYFIALESLELDRAEKIRQEKPSPLSHLEWWAVALHVQVRHLAITRRASSAAEICDAVAAAGLPQPGSDGWQAVALTQARLMCRAPGAPEPHGVVDSDPWAVVSRRVHHLTLGRIDQVVTPHDAEDTSGSDVRPALALRLLRAQALHESGQSDEARALLRDTLTTVFQRGVLSMLAYLTPSGLELIADTTEGATAAALVRKHDVPLLECVTLTSAPLTPAEVDVLRLLALRRTRQEIADELFLSVHTVKSHLASAYRKLGVRTRDEAVAKVQQLAL
ncbi:helix-turn-helix transcriptional regulator [Nocardioides sp. Y6]|uniref:Helix-turn-helix transcriptional regulator n=1 Tax=Nocardioides malaquae TaxID=2773426 RepID=A0ABR9RT07_9ACTN|nr:helix-turn-helix transcriptional regulator [Nocardioides malaquae]MBE7324515.1 helix-turn-helix transcriptional regulator [Nocardioides malaquae]